MQLLKITIVKEQAVFMLMKDNNSNLNMESRRRILNLTLLHGKRFCGRHVVPGVVTFIYYENMFSNWKHASTKRRKYGQHPHRMTFSKSLLDN